MITLENRYLVADFSPATGGLVHLSAAGSDTNLIRGSWCSYYESNTDAWFGNPEFQKQARPFQIVRFQPSERAVVSVTRSPHVEVIQRFELAPDNPLLEIGVEVRGIAAEGSLAAGGFPHVQFAQDIHDPFADEHQLFFDGAELDGGREIPCWRVFFRTGYRDGLMIATRSKLAMTRFQILADAFELRPNQVHNYSTALTQKPIEVTPKMKYRVEFEIGPWAKTKHAVILRAAKLQQPINVGNPPPKGTPPRKLKGYIFRAARFAPQSSLAATFHLQKWTRARMPWAVGGRALFAAPGVRPPPLVVNPKLKGTYRIFVGIGNGAGIKMSLSGDLEPTFRVSMRHADSTDMSPAFQLYLSGRHKASETEYGVARMDGRKVRLERFPNRFTACVVDYVRFEKLSPAQVARWEREEKAEPCIPLSGHNDIPDIAHLLDRDDPDPATFSANIWEHARCKVRKIFWRIDGQCSDYPSKLNTMRYPLAKTHGVFDPQSPAYGRALKKTDVLKLAVAAAKKYGCQLYGWMRFNSYMGNVQSEFFTKNPQFWEEWESGGKGRKLCLAWPEVRKHKIDILVEAAGYGLNGLNLGFLRHPPVLLYAEVMREAYKREYGKEPPRDPKHPDAHHTKSLPDRGDPEYVRWWKFRAQYLTQFGRELRAALREKGLSHVKIAIWVRPNHCLFDGIDMEAWLNEGLCDEVVSDFYAGGTPMDLYWDRPEWKKMVQAKAKLIRGVPMNAREAQALIRRILRERYDGICTYESDLTVLDSEFIKLYRSLRK